MTISRASSFPSSTSMIHSSLPDFDFRTSDQDSHSNPSSGYSTPTPATNMGSWSCSSVPMETPEIKSMDYPENNATDSDARARATVAISSSTAPQILSAEQYLTMMNEAAGRVRALAEEEQSMSFSAPNTFVANVHPEEYRRQMSNAIHPYQQYQPRHHSPYYQAAHLAAVRRTHSMDATSHMMNFSLNSNNHSSPGSSPMMVLQSQAHFQKNNNMHDDPSQNGDYFVSSAADLGMGLGGVNMVMANPHLSVGSSMPLPISQRRNTDPSMYYPSSFSSNLSSSFLSSSSSASPSPSPPSPLMLSTSPSSLGLPSCSDRKRLSIVSTASSTPTLCSSSKSSHDGIKKPKARYVCHYPNCHRTFSRPFNLKSHGLTHETRRPHACDQCPKTFARVHDRDRHMKGHLLEKAHSCIVCQGRFARQDAVTRHLKLANEQNPCAMILKNHGISFREAAAGRVQRSVLGDDAVIRRTLEQLEEQARKLRATKNLEMGMMSMGVNMSAMNLSGMGNVNHLNAANAMNMNAMGMGMNMNAMHMGMNMHGIPSLNAATAGTVTSLATMGGLGGYSPADIEHAFR